MSALSVRANERVPGWDGTPLALDLHLPPSDAWPVPAVVTRTPYGRSGHLAEGAGWRRRGFAYVVQDVRGRYDSDGTWKPYRNERGDGAPRPAPVAGPGEDGVQGHR
ncbi:CocE/NonD family hydrolase, partial [Streptomyces griseorubiginosus]|uniref:CocE/NonD family hydrolase n=1 Tax=Streptomyces griseorubiginosus TaxID=67304 RepID=UPI0033F43D2F